MSFIRNSLLGKYQIVNFIRNSLSKHLVFSTEYLICISISLSLSISVSVSAGRSISHFWETFASKLRGVTLFLDLPSKGPLGSWVPPGCLSGLSRCIPDTSKMPPRCLQMPPRCLQMPPRCLQMPPDASRCLQMTPDASRCLQMLPDAIPDASRCLKMTPDASR